MSSVKSEALELLRSPYFFRRLLKDLRRSGLVGEKNNALVAYVTACSRLLPEPVSLLVKGSSSSGKNWMVDRVLNLFPPAGVRKFSGSSAKSWNYQQENLKHKVLFLEERNEASGPVDPMRLLISEGRLTSYVTERSGRHSTVREYVTKGPVAAISTTTRNRIQIDDENRHVSIWIDESQEQTGRIVEGIVERELKTGSKLSEEDRLCWRMVQRMLKGRSEFPITFPAWLKQVGQSVDCSSIRNRRYFSAYLRAVKTVALIRSFNRSKEQLEQANGIVVRFSDLAVATCIFGSAFADSLKRATSSDIETRQRIMSLSAANDGRGVSACDLSHAMNISTDKAYAIIREAYEAGTIRRANKSNKTNLKLYLPSESQGFLPELEELFNKLVGGPQTVKFVHPLTGAWVKYDRADSDEEE